MSFVEGLPISNDCGQLLVGSIIYFTEVLASVSVVTGSVFFVNRNCGERRVDETYAAQILAVCYSAGVGGRLTTCMLN